ncbi:MAG: GCN5-related N-acetyltransferase [Gammaproteobacteria bacterium]|nr:GCN5-related N-acetyltransferase [Gammaproteobacteria bacterium]
MQNSKRASLPRVSNKVPAESILSTFRDASFMTSYTVRQVSWQEAIEDLRAIRFTVFVEEQHVPLAEEWDGRDDTALHVLALSADHQPLGTARLLDNGQIGRMAVLREHRRLGIGSALLRELLHIAATNNMQHLFLNAQIDAVGFYQRHGFIEQGATFMDAGIVHRKMVLAAAK